MVWGIRGRTITALCLVLVLALAVGFYFLVASEEAPAEGEKGPAPKVLRELTDKRQVYSTTYLLENGQRKTVMSTVPVHYKDASGAFQPVDLTPEATADGRLEVAKAPVAVSFANEAEGVPAVTLTNADGTLTLDLLEASEDEGAGQGTGVRYAKVLPEVDAFYEATGDGLKQTLILASAAAPDAYSFALSHPGLEMRKSETGQWCLYKPEAKEPAYLLSGLTVFDASADEAGVPAFCDEARLTVEPGKGASTITYSVPREWLDDTERVYPVTIDPTLTVPSPTDTYIAAGYGNTSFGSLGILYAGRVSTDTGSCKTLIKFPQVNSDIPFLAHVAAANLKVRQYWQPDPNNDETRLFRVGDDSTDWNESSTWNSISFGSNVLIRYVPLAGNVWLNESVIGTVQHWVVCSAPYNKGFLLQQHTDQDASYARAFRSNESPYSDYRPELSVVWEEPTMAVSLDKTNATVGETVKATVSIGSVAYPEQITDVKLAVNRNDGDASRRRGIFAWFKAPPTEAGYVYVQARNASNQPDGYFAYLSSTSYNSDKVTLLPEASVVSNDHKTVTFAFAPNETWGAPDTNKFDVRMGMLASNRTWTSYWVPKTSPSFNVSQNAGTPKALESVSATTTASSGWFTGTVNDSATQGRGGVTLSWPSVPLADTYKVYLWDGAKDNLLTTTATTSYTVPTNIFPTDTQIAALAQGYTGNPFNRSNGLSLRDNPNLLYQKMAGSSNSDTDYRFKVVPHNNGANADAPDCAPLRLTLDNRTVTTSEDPQHADYEFESWNGHGVGVRLETGALTARTTDLAIASYGPPAELSRSYISSETAAGIYAPGWFFNFEQNLAVGANQIVFTDALRQPHTFTGSGSTWSAPNGFLASLAPDGSNWKLTFYGGQSLIFDSSGKLIQVKDDYGNTTAYTWTSGKLTRITAANGQYIDLTYSGSKLASASYTTAAGTRAVSYATASPWSITCYPNTSCTSTLSYGYDASTRLSAITQADWPASGQSVAETFTYTSGKLTELRYADYHAASKPDARATISYGTNQATIDRYGTVTSGTPPTTTANQPMNREVLSYRASSAGVPYQLTSRTSGISQTHTESYSYAFDRQLAGTADSEGGLSASSFDTNHDLVSTTTTTGAFSSANQTTDYTYDSAHRLTSEKRYQSAAVYALTTNTYTGAKLTATQTANQSGSVLSAATYDYETNGTLKQEKKLITGTPSSGTWTQTDYSNFAASGEPQTTIARGVKLSSSANAQDLTMTKSYDAFGNLLTETDWSNSRVTATNTYDIAGRQLTSTDAASVVTQTSYDRMGNASESYRTAPNTQVKADWRATSYDALGRELTVTTKLSDTSGNGTTASVLTHVYDGSGNELTSNDSTQGGQDAKTSYDAQGKASESWAEGVASYATTGVSTRSVYDASGNLIYESAPGNTNTPGSATACSATTYDDAGNSLTQREPDGTSERLAYDGQGNQEASEGEAASGTFSPWDTETIHDAAGQTTAATDPQQSHDGLVTTSSLDRLGRTTSATAERDSGSEPATATTYNDLDWVLSSTDANGVTTATTYNAHGQVVGVTKGTKTTTSSYNATTGRLESAEDNDGTTATYTYDAFGNATRVLEEADGGADLKDTNTTFDSLGRPTAISEAVAGTSRSFTYPVNTASGVQESLSYGTSAATSLAVSRNARNMETARTATIASGTTVTRSVSDPTGRDAADRWTSATVQQSGRSAKTMTRTFDNADHVTSQSGLGFTSGQSASYTFDANTGKKSAAALPLLFGGAVDDDYAYYPGGRLASVTTPASEASYAFDEVGNLVRDTVTDLSTEEVVTTSFFYDDPNSSADDNRNRLWKSTYLGPEEDAVEVATYYAWDATNSWRTSQGSTATVANHEIQIAYNAQGRMSAYASPTVTSATYSYDATGQRTKSIVTPAGGTATTTTYAYDGLTLLKLSATQGSDSWKIEYLYDEDGRPYGGVYRSPASSSSPTYFNIVTNDHGDVLALCDADGAAFASYRYDAWGSPVSASTQATTLVTSTLAGQIASRQILRYASYAFDAESGFYYCSARYYDPVTRQWTSGDPAKADGEESAYQYCGGEPVGGVDPTGEYFVPLKYLNAMKRFAGWHCLFWKYIYHYPAQNLGHYLQSVGGSMWAAGLLSSAVGGGASSAAIITIFGINTSYVGYCIDKASEGASWNGASVGCWLYISRWYGFDVALTVDGRSVYYVHRGVVYAPRILEAVYPWYFN